MELDQPTATLIAATLAGVLSLANFVLGQRAGRSSEGRAQYRQLLMPHVTELGEVLHKVVATATVAVGRKKQGRTEGTWLARTKKACDELRDLRLRVKYPLWGVEDGLRALTRLGHWMEAKIEIEDERVALLSSAEALRRALDASVRRAYLRGAPPGLITRWWVSRLTKSMYKRWNDGSPLRDEEE